MLGLWRTVPLPRESQSTRRWLAAFFGELAILVWWLSPEQGEEERRRVVLGSCLATLGCVQLAPGRWILRAPCLLPHRGLFQKVIVCQCLLAVIRGSGMKFTILGGFLANLITTKGTLRATVSHFTVPKRDVLPVSTVCASILDG